MTNAALNFRSKRPNSRWTDQHEKLLTDMEKRVMNREQPRPTKQWKKLSPNSISKLDAAYEEHCVIFLDHYIQERPI
jgi:hypothetical protein